MPELPEVETVVRELDKKLKGKRILSVDVRMPKIISIGPAVVSNIRKPTALRTKEFKRLLEGQRIVSVKRRAKMLIFDLSGPLSLLVHLKMTGQFIFEDKASRVKTGSKYRILNKLTAPLVQLPGKHTHVLFKFSGGGILYYNDIRQFGYLRVVKDEDLQHVKELKEYGPEPLEKAFTFAVFSKNVHRKLRTSIKLAVMDPKVVAGIGNIYSDEILFLAGVHPARLVSSLEEAELKAIYGYIGHVLKKGIKTKGSSVGDFIRTDGSWGKMGKYHWVYGRKGLACKSCGVMLKSVKLGGRTGTFCPTCQQ